MAKRRVYLDNNATTRVDDRVAEIMKEYFLSDYAVASSQFSHTPGIRAKDAVEKARFLLAEKLGAKTDEIVFTSGATEANNLALKGLAAASQGGTRNKVVISRIEHFSVLDTARTLEKTGFRVEQANVDQEGFVDLEHLKSLVDERTLLVSVIAASHEAGTVQDLKAVSAIAHDRGAFLHTDAAVAFLQAPVKIPETGADLLSISGHKIHGPKGVGALFVRKGLKLEKIMEGGFQEFNLRPGTENVPGIAGLGRAVEIHSIRDTERIAALRDYLYQKIKKEISGVLLNGASDFSRRIPNNLNVSFEYIEGESVVLHLDMRGIAVITGSACFSRSLQASHVLLAMGFTHERAHGSIRFSLSKYTTRKDIDYTVKNAREVVEQLRKISPLYQVKGSDPEKTSGGRS